jgi:hypothetical protein
VLNILNGCVTEQLWRHFPANLTGLVSKDILRVCALNYCWGVPEQVTVHLIELIQVIHGIAYVSLTDTISNFGLVKQLCVYSRAWRGIYTGQHHCQLKFHILYLYLK